MARLVLVLLLIGWKTGASLLSQSRNFFRQSFEKCSINVIYHRHRFTFSDVVIIKMIAVIFAGIVLFPPLRRHQGFNPVQITAKEMAFFFQRRAKSRAVSVADTNKTIKEYRGQIRFEQCVWNCIFVSLRIKREFKKQRCHISYHFLSFTSQRNKKTKRYRRSQR